MTTAEAMNDVAVEKHIRDVVAGIEVHVTGLEGLISKFYDDVDGDDDDGGAGLAHLEVLSSVFDDLVEGHLKAGWEKDAIWSEKERDTWSPFATEVTNHVYAIPPLLLQVQDLRVQTTRPHAFANLVDLSERITALFGHKEPDEDRVERSRQASRQEDEEAYAAWSEPLEPFDADDPDFEAQ